MKTFSQVSNSLKFASASSITKNFAFNMSVSVHGLYAQWFLFIFTGMQQHPMVLSCKYATPAACK
jgi:hypothetical protein